MRQLLVQVPAGQGENVLKVAESHRGTNLACVSASGADGLLDLVYIHVSNGNVEALLDDLESFRNLRVSFFPTGVMALHPPDDQAAEQVTDVGERSPVEVFLGGLQSIGSWRGFLGYAAAAGVVVWIALFTNSVFLQIAAMLIAPFAGPAMNAALATARGDAILLRQSVLRYFSAIAVTIVTAGLLHWLLGNNLVTDDMISVSKVASVAALLPLIAGAAGALNLVQSQRSSLVTGAATGVLVAAALAPPAGVVGMAAVMGEWGMMVNGLFLLLLQLTGINLAGALMFRFFGLSTQGARYDRGRSWIFPTSWAVTVLLFAGLLVWQLSDPPMLQRSTREQRASGQVQQVLEESDLAVLVESNARFTRSNIPGQNTLLVTVYAQRREDVERPTAEIRRELQAAIEQRLATRFDVTPLVDVTLFETPADNPPETESE
jgi:uncharacterized membrane protein